MRRDARFVSLALLAAGLVMAPARVLEGQASGGNVLAMTPENLDRLSKGLAAEEAARKGLAEKAAKTKSSGEYNQCRNGVMLGPDGMKLLNDFDVETKKHKGDAAAVQKAAEEMQKNLEALVEKRCGPNPSVSRADASGRQREIAEAAAKDAGLTPRQYAILKERVAPLCALGEVPNGPDGAKLKGSGDAYWVYSASEVAALRPRCAALMKALRVEKR